MKEERFLHTRKHLHWRRQGVAGGGSFGTTEKSTPTGVQTAKRRDSCTEDQCLRGLSAHLPGHRWELGAEAQASKVRSQGEDWGWLCEHSLKGASAPQLAGREPGKKSGPA